LELDCPLSGAIDIGILHSLYNQQKKADQGFVLKKYSLNGSRNAKTFQILWQASGRTGPLFEKGLFLRAEVASGDERPADDRLGRRARAEKPEKALAFEFPSVEEIAEFI
jgi:hypothetical protein